MKSYDIIQTLIAMDDVQPYIENGYNLYDLVTSGVFNKYGIGNIFNTVYGPYDIGVGAMIEIEHEADEQCRRIVQISYEDNNNRIIEPSYNYAISMTPTTTSILKVRSASGGDIQRTYVTIMFRKHKTKFDDKENGVLIFNNTYIMRRKVMLSKLVPENDVNKAYVSEDNTSYYWSNDEWYPVLRLASINDGPAVDLPRYAANVNYNRFCYCEYTRNELVGSGMSLVIAYPPVSSLNNVFATVGQYDDINKEHLYQYECRKYLDKFIISNTFTRATLFDLRLWVGYPDEQTVKAYYNRLVKYIVDTEIITTTQETNSRTSIDSFMFDINQI